MKNGYAITGIMGILSAAYALAVTYGMTPFLEIAFPFLVGVNTGLILAGGFLMGAGLVGYLLHSYYQDVMDEKDKKEMEK